MDLGQVQEMRKADQALFGKLEDCAPAEVLQCLRKNARNNPIRQKWETAVRLHDGRWVGSWSQDWQLECEAAYLLRMPLAQRRAALAKREEVRGWKPVEFLKARMTAIHRARSVAKTSTVD